MHSIDLLDILYQIIIILEKVIIIILQVCNNNCSETEVVIYVIVQGVHVTIRHMIYTDKIITAYGPNQRQYLSFSRLPR